MDYFNILFLPSGYESGLTRLWNLVKSRVLADLSMKNWETVFGTFVWFFELFWEVFPPTFPQVVLHIVRKFLNILGNLKIYFGGFENE